MSSGLTLEARLAALRGEEGREAVGVLVGELAADELRFLATLRRDVPAALLEYVGTTRPWCDDARLAGVVVANPVTPGYVALRLLSGLYWRDLSEVASRLQLSGVLRVRAEGLLVERLPELRLGDKIALARRATAAVLRALLGERDTKTLAAALFNPRLHQEALLGVLRRETACRELFEAVAVSPRWRGNYAISRELVFLPRVPLGVALGRLSSLRRGDHRLAAADQRLRPLLRAAAQRLVDEPRARRTR